MTTAPAHALSRPLITILLFVSVLSCQVQEPSEIVPGSGNAKKEFSGGFIPGIISVQLDEATASRVEQALALGASVATKAPALGGVFDELGVKSMRRVFPYAGKYEGRTRRSGLHRFYYLEFDSEMPVTRAAADLRDIPGIISVSPQLRIEPRVFNDPYFTSQWHYVNERYSGADINIQKVWDEFTVGSPNVIVSVVDEGVNMDHEDLQGNLIPCYDNGTGSYNFNNDTPRVVPTQGHGSHVAGIIAAVSNNGKGVAGVAGGDYANGKPGVKVMSCQIFDLYGNQPDIYQAIKHGADNGALILQCSWGFSPDLDHDGFTTDEEIDLYCSFTIDDLPEYKAAIDYFIEYAGCDDAGNQLPDSPMKGGVAVFAAGNDNFYYDPLVSYEPIIAVGAFGATGKKASYSNYGEWIDVAAPGGDAKQGIYSTLLGNGYGGADWQGTSMACPHVSAVAALLVSYYGGPGFTAEECRKRIIRGSVPNFFTGSRYIGRKLDAYGAFTYDMNTRPQSPSLSWSGSVPATLPHNGKATVPFTVSDPQSLQVKVSVKDDMAGVTVLHSYEEGYSMVIDASKMAPGSHSITLVGVNEDNMKAELQATVQVLENMAPVVVADAAGLEQIFNAPGEETTVDLNTLFSDPEGDALTFSATVVGGKGVAVIETGEDGILKITGAKTGVSSVLVSANDGQLSAGLRIKIAVKDAKDVYLESTRASRYLTLYVQTTQSVRVGLKVVDTSGAVVYDGGESADIFTPVSIDVQKLSPGIYTLLATIDKHTMELRFVKL